MIILGNKKFRTKNKTNLTCPSNSYELNKNKRLSKMILLPN